MQGSLVTVHPARVAAAALSCVDLAVAVGEAAGATLGELADALGPATARAASADLTAGEALAWWGDQAPLPFHMAPTRSESRRHRRKYGRGNWGADRAFTFRGPGDRLSLQARNLLQFIELGEGVDDETWMHHLRRVTTRPGSHIASRTGAWPRMPPGSRRTMPSAPPRAARASARPSRSATPLPRERAGPRPGTARCPVAPRG